MEPETADAKSPLLEAWRRGRLSRRNSVNSLRNDFISRLPDNVLSAVDPESPSSYFDVSRAQGLSQGTSSILVGARMLNVISLFLPSIFCFLCNFGLILKFYFRAGISIENWCFLMINS